MSEEYGYYAEETEMTEITEGHGQTDVSCVHGSRWIWWRDKIFNPKGAWLCSRYQNRRGGENPE